MRRFVLVFLLLLGCQFVFSQNSNITVNFLTELTNDTEGSVARRLDNRDKKCALIKVRTPNLNAEERQKLNFQGDAATEIFVEKGTGELKLFLTEGAKKLRIMHDDYGVMEYSIPIQIVGFKTYLMEIDVDKSAIMAVNKKPKRSANYVEINVTPSDAIVMVDDKPVSDGTVYLEIDEDHTLTVSKTMYHTHTITPR